ncbi:MAG: type II secretion system protein GspG [Lentisphaerae bacterium]|nr:type II secretion system protein GspG [Lentisphaerota bacterium]
MRTPHTRIGNRQSRRNSRGAPRPPGAGGRAGGGCPANPSPASGFTLIELMVVVIIIAALAGMVLPRVLPATDEAKSNIALGDIAGITLALKMYRLHNDRFPSTEEGLDALMAAPSTARNWKGPYLEKKARDPWKRPYNYRYPGSHNPHGFDIWSLGPSEEDAGDDVTNWGE